MALPPSFLDEIRDRVPVSEVVGRAVKLTRAGREFKGLCPFHKEKSPSFTVNDDKGFYHCFGCGAHGDVISFLTDHDRMAFMDAVEILAGRAGLAMPEQTPEARREEARRKTLHETIEEACRFFEEQLAEPAGRTARAYLEGRGVDPETMRTFRLGYAPRDGTLLAHMKARGFELDQLIEAGLARRPDDGRDAYAFFRDRVIFPVEDRRGRVVAFGGRVLEGDGPKYVNSSDNPLFHKGQLLYNFARARQAAGQGHSVVVVEGYMDVIALVKAGFRGAVAPLGTALTEEQIKLLWQVTKTPYLCFDGDEAGGRAALRAVDRLFPHLVPDRSVRIAYMSAGEDPDSLIRNVGRQAMREVLQQGHSLAETVWRAAVTAHSVSTPEGRAGLRTALRQRAQSIHDPEVREAYRRDFDERFLAAYGARRGGYDGRDRGQAGMGYGGGGYRRQGGDRRFVPPGPRPGGRKSATGVAHVLLAGIVRHPALADDLLEPLGLLDLPDPRMAALRDAVMAYLAAGEGLDSSRLGSHLTSIGLEDAVMRLQSLVRDRAPFLFIEGDEERVRQGLVSAWHHHLGRQLRDELDAARSRAQSEPTDGNLARVRELARLVDGHRIGFDDQGS
ncbi:MAG: DNA primase [Azospirillaceae bacterium]